MICCGQEDDFHLNVFEKLKTDVIPIVIYQRTNFVVIRSAILNIKKTRKVSHKERIKTLSFEGEKFLIEEVLL